MLILIFLAAIIFQAYIDKMEIQAGKAINHLLESAIIAMLLFIGLLSKTHFDIKRTLLLALLYMGIRFLLFDIILNYLRGLPLSYIGESKQPSLEDRMLKVHAMNQWELKICFLVLTIILNILL